MSLVGVIGASLGSAAFFSVATALKHASAGQMPRVHHFRPTELLGFAAATLRHPLWLFGILADVGGLGLQVLALHLGALTVVQPVLVSAVLFALVVAHRVAGTRISRRELVLGAALVISVGSFLAVSGAATARAEQTDQLPAALAAVASIVMVAGCVVASRRATRRKLGSRRAAALLGIGVGTIYAGTAALIKACTNLAADGPAALLTSWQPYALVAAGATGLLLAQMAFQAGPLAASLPATAAVDPLVSVILGVVVYDEQLSKGVGPILASLLFLVTMSVAVVLLSRVRVAVDEGVHHHQSGRSTGSGGVEAMGAVEPVTSPRDGDQ
ncbi:DMT family transporter [Lapillicoccus sp.]|uniref:DMT family transporter n=1 Tax=Lapillicoccus sp. TaxID=1909287 RepID=UPI003983523A